MTTNVLIGVGGTGAKVVEAALWMFLSGVGPREVIVGLVDQDKANGNVGRTISLINNIIRLRDDFGPNKGNALDWKSDEAVGGTRFASIKITPMMKEAGPHWRPADDGPQTLSGILDAAGMDGEDGMTDFFNVLFREGDSEQTMPLDEGYRGRAHIGSAAMLAALEFGKGGFKARMEELISRGGENEEVRIFLAGSVFGGTGAAGFPTLARVLDALRKKKAEEKPEVANSVRIGGALMLPYFGFEDPKSKDANVVTNNDLVPQARSALEYYHSLFREGEGVDDRAIFDRFYVSGWNELFRMEYHEPGAADQINPAQPPELLGASAVLDFFEANLGTRSQTVPIMVSTRGSERDFRWADMAAETDLRHRIYDGLGRLMRLSFWWRHEAEPEFEKRKAFLHQKQPWMSLTKDVKWDEHTPDARTHLLDILHDFLFWAGCMRWSAGDQLNFDLWDTTAVHDPRHEPQDDQKVTKPIAIRSKGQGEMDVEDAFARSLPALDRQQGVRESKEVVTEISRNPPTAKNAGLGRLLAATYRAVRPIEASKSQ